MLRALAVKSLDDRLGSHGCLVDRTVPEIYDLFRMPERPRCVDHSAGMMPGISGGRGMVLRDHTRHFSVTDRPCKPAIPDPLVFPFQPDAGSHTSNSMCESFDGCRIPWTRQNAGSVLNEGTPPGPCCEEPAGSVKPPAATFPAAVIVVFASFRPERFSRISRGCRNRRPCDAEQYRQDSEGSHRFSSFPDWFRVSSAVEPEAKNRLSGAGSRCNVSPESSPSGGFMQSKLTHPFLRMHPCIIQKKGPPQISSIGLRDCFFGGGCPGIRCDGAEATWQSAEIGRDAYALCVPAQTLTQHRTQSSMATFLPYGTKRNS